MSAVFVPPHLRGKTYSTAETIQKLLEENNYLIQVVVDFQNKGRTAETMEYLKTLHRNLVYLLQVADLNINQSLPPPDVLPLTSQSNGTSSFGQNPNVPYVSCNSPQLLNTSQHVSSASSNFGQQCGVFPQQNMMHNASNTPNNMCNHSAAIESNPASGNPLSPFSHCSPKSSGNMLGRPTMHELSSPNPSHNYSNVSASCENQAANVSPMSMMSNSQKVNSQRNEQITSVNSLNGSTTTQLNRLANNQNESATGLSNEMTVQQINNQNENNSIHNRMNERHALLSDMKPTSIECNPNINSGFITSQQSNHFSLQNSSDKAPQSGSHNVQQAIMNGGSSASPMFANVSQANTHIYSQMNHHSYGMNQSNQLLNQFNQAQFVQMQPQISQINHSMQSSQSQSPFGFSYNSPVSNSQCSADQGGHYLSSPQ